METREDRAAAQMHAWREKNKDSDKKGLRPVIFPVDLEGKPMEYGGLTRQQFGEAASQVEQDELEGIDVERERPPGGYNPADYGDG